jgi:hypothetical protein
MSAITLRGTKGEPLTHDEVDANFDNLNTDKYQSGDNITAGTLTTTGNAGIGTATPTALLTLSKEATGASSSSGIIQYCYGDVVRYQQYHANGTEASPTASLSGNNLTQFSARGYTGSAFTAGVANIEMVAEDDFSTSTKAGISFRTHNGTSLAERMRVKSNGNVGLDVGNGDGYGITFNSTTHNAATTLDYYEEGTWTPVLGDSYIGGNTATASAKGAYTRIGRLVTCTFSLYSIDTTGLLAANTLFLRGLPFTSHSTTTNPSSDQSLGFWNNMTISGVGVNLSIRYSSGDTYGQFFVVKTSGGMSNILVSALTSGTASLGGTFTYFTNT